jgi:hypothetical protein
MEARVDEGGSLEASFLDTLTRLRVLVELPPIPANAIARAERERIVRAGYEARWHSALGRHPMTAEMLGAELERLAPGNSVSDAFREQTARDLEPGGARNSRVAPRAIRLIESVAVRFKRDRASAAGLFRRGRTPRVPSKTRPASSDGTPRSQLRPHETSHLRHAARRRSAALLG